MLELNHTVAKTAVVVAFGLMITRMSMLVNVAGKNLINVSTGFCLDSNDKDKDKGNVYTGGCNNGNYQNWESLAGKSAYSYYPEVFL